MEETKYENILYEKNEKIAKIVLNRPAKLNTINRGMAIELKHALLDLEKDNNIKVGIITGSGEKAFSAGGDISIFPELLKDITAAYNWNKTGYDIHRFMERIEKPIIAAVNGYCLAGGLEIALACDFIIASDNASFGLAEITIGLVPAWGGSIRLPRAIPARRAKEMIYTGEPIDAQQAEKFGLVNKVVSLDQLNECVNEIAKKIADKSSLAIRVSKTIINHGLETADIDTGLILERGAVGIFTAGSDSKEGVKAFLEKKSSKFKS